MGESPLSRSLVLAHFWALSSDDTAQSFWEGMSEMTEPKTFGELTTFTPVFEVVIESFNEKPLQGRKHGDRRKKRVKISPLIASAVYGRVYRRCDNGSEDGRSYLGSRRVARELGISRRQVNRVMEALVEAGYLIDCSDENDDSRDRLQFRKLRSYRIPQSVDAVITVPSERVGHSAPDVSQVGTEVEIEGVGHREQDVGHRVPPVGHRVPKERTKKTSKETSKAVVVVGSIEEKNPEPKNQEPQIIEDLKAEGVYDEIAERVGEDIAEDHAKKALTDYQSAKDQGVEIGAGVLARTIQKVTRRIRIPKVIGDYWGSSEEKADNDDHMDQFGVIDGEQVE